MDHKVSKDMISSGMIPSGEKTQADLGRIQYGSNPTPNAFADAYKSMYEKKEEVINEHHKKDADGNTIENPAATLYHSRRIPDYRDIDKTIEDFIVYFKNKYLPNVQFNTATNKRLFIKNALDFYRAKGTERAVDLFFKLVYGLEAQVYYPGDDLFRLSDNSWQNVTYIEIIPNPNNVGVGLPYTQDKLTTAYSPSNFMFTKTYGVAPSNTTLTIRYLTGGGVAANVPANTLNTILNLNNVFFTTDTLDPVLSQTTFDSLAINNPNPATGGGDGDSIQDLRANSLASYASQLRSVTQEDYLVRALSMPSQYGSLAKAYVEPQKLDNLLPGEKSSILDLYVLAFNDNKKLVSTSNALKQNLSTYLSQYRIINDSIRIKDAFVINIGINFEIVVLPNFNSNEVLTNCINKLIEYFNVDNMQINQPILINELYLMLNSIKGVQNVKDIKFNNKVGESLGYSKYAYDVGGATANGVVYPSQDPSIFEVKFPNTDIKGRVVPL